MGRLFSVPKERESILDGFDEHHEEVGTVVLWYHFLEEITAAHPTYGESYVYGGRIFSGPHKVPVLWAHGFEGREQTGDGQGFYTTDLLRVVVSYRQLRRTIGLGLPIDLDLDRYINRDRIIYRGVVYGVQIVDIQGSIRDPTVVIGIQAAEIDPDELVNDPEFQSYATPVGVVSGAGSFIETFEETF